MENYLIESHDYKGFTIEIHQDPDARNPRTEFDNVGTLVNGDRDSCQGDENGNLEFMESELFSLACYDDEYADDLKKGNYEDQIVKRIERMGYVIILESDRFIYASRAKCIEEWGKQYRKKALAYLQAELDTVDMWRNGQVYGYVVKDSEGNEVEDGSCWGCYGLEFCQSEAESIVNWYIENESKLLGEALGVNIAQL